MNYRITSDFRTPFRIFPFFELVSPYKVELIIKVSPPLCLLLHACVTRWQLWMLNNISCQGPS